MLLFDGVLGLVMIGLWLFCIIDVITTPGNAVRNLPKMAWLFIVVLLGDIGSIAWLVAGRNWSGVQGRLAEKGNPGAKVRAAAGPGTVRRATNPDDDEDFLAGLQARADEQRRRARERDDGGTSAA